MVRTASHIGSHTLRLILPIIARAQRQACGSHSGADRTSRPFRHGQAPGKTNFPLGCCRQRALGDRCNVVRCVCQSQLTVAGSRRLNHLDTRHFLHHPVTQQFVLCHRKTMPFRERQDEVIGVESLQNQT